MRRRESIFVVARPRRTSRVRSRWSVGRGTTSDFRVFSLHPRPPEIHAVYSFNALDFRCSDVRCAPVSFLACARSRLQQLTRSSLPTLRLDLSLDSTHLKPILFRQKETRAIRKFFTSWRSSRTMLPLTSTASRATSVLLARRWALTCRFVLIMG
jgi:hypothetical protein